MNIGIIGAIGVDDIGDVIMLQEDLKLLQNIRLKKTRCKIYNICIK